MPHLHPSRRNFLRAVGAAAGSALLSPVRLLSQPSTAEENGTAAQIDSGPADYTLTIATTPVEIAPNRVISVTTYNGQFPGPLLRFKEGQKVTIQIHNKTDTPEQLHWHGQFVSTDVD